MTAPELGIFSGFVGYHRGFINNKHGVAVSVPVEAECTIFSGSLAVNGFVYGESRMAAVTGQHLGCPSRRSHQHTIKLVGLKVANQRADQAGLARACVSLEQKHIGVIPCQQIRGQTVQRLGLLNRGLKREVGGYLLNQGSRDHFTDIYTQK
ncbi:MAG: hypothetical protein BWY72_00618 [Bacteroidetes bacterium ADurb.Bin416]|nr:MAG: hypothetical protein BWY72_00618 [Bacteroidetes bacterium ADurb.Bin416]